jgi:hypothetical protein
MVGSVKIKCLLRLVIWREIVIFRIFLHIPPLLNIRRWILESLGPWQVEVLSRDFNGD